MAKYVDKFCLNDEIAKNAYSKTYKGIDRNTSQEVLIKVFALHLIDQNKLYHQKILNEMTIIESLESEYTIKPISYLKTSNNMYHVYERYPEGSLANYIKKSGKIPENQSLELFRRILECIKDLHTNNTLHRDLRPSAFMFKGGKLYITNFFNAIVLNNPEIENNEVVSKNNHYKAPENIKKNFDYTKKSDIYALGVIVYKMIYGELPNRKTVISKLSNTNTDVARLLRKLLEEEPDLRLSASEALYFLDQNTSKSMDDSKIRPAEQIKLSFDNFRQKMDFLMRFGNFLYLNKNIAETAVMMHYLVMKKAYLLTKSFKEHFSALKKTADADSSLQAYEDFLKGIERESLTHLISFQNVLNNAVDVGKYYDLSKDLESLDTFANFEGLYRTIITPLMNASKEVSLDKMCQELCKTFTENERAHNFNVFNKPLIVPYN